MKYKTINFYELINLKKIQTLSWHYESIDFNEFRKTRKIFKEEKYANPGYYDYDFDYYSEEDENYKKDWTRFNWIDTEFWGDEFNDNDQTWKSKLRRKQKPIDLKPIAIVPARIPGPQIKTSINAHIKEFTDRDDTMINKAMVRIIG